MVIGLDKATGKLLYQVTLPISSQRDASVNRLHAINQYNNVPLNQCYWLDGLCSDIHCLDGKVFVVNHGYSDPELFVLDCVSGHLLLTIEPGDDVGPALRLIAPHAVANVLTFGCTALDHGHFIDFDSAPNGPPTHIDYIAGNYLAQYHVDDYGNPTTYPWVVGVSLLSVDFLKKDQIIDLWHDKFISKNVPNKPIQFYGPYLGMVNSRYVLFKTNLDIGASYFESSVSKDGVEVSRETFDGTMLEQLLNGPEDFFLTQERHTYTEHSLSRGLIRQFGNENLNYVTLLPSGLIVVRTSPLPSKSNRRHFFCTVFPYG